VKEEVKATKPQAWVKPSKLMYKPRPPKQPKAPKIVDKEFTPPKPVEKKSNSGVDMSLSIEADEILKIDGGGNFFGL